MTRASVLLLSVLIAVGCGAGDVTLVLDLRTDLVAGAEFSSIVVALPEEELELAPIEVALGDRYVGTGARVAELEGLAPSTARRVHVRLLDAAGALVSETELLVRNTAATAAVIVVSRDCRDLACPGAGDPGGNTRCLGGRCVEPECLTGSETSCPVPQCTDDGGCPAAGACARGVCQDGVCLFEADGDSCAVDEFCEPRRGCREAPEVLESEHCEPESFVVPDTCTDGPACALRVSVVSADYLHTCAVDMTGSLYCWGHNAHGQLGLGDRFSRRRAAEVALPVPASSVDVGDSFSCALSTDGSIRCWGRNTDGQLGLGDTTTRIEPTDPIPGGPWTAVSAGDDHACALDTAGAIFCWGSNREGQAGQDDIGAAGQDYLSPVEIAGGGVWVSVDVSSGHSCGIQMDGSLHCWGRNSEGQLGQPATAPEQVRTPQRVGAEIDWMQVDTSQGSACGRRMDGSMWCWGNDSMTYSSIGFGGIGVVYEPMQRVEMGPWLDVETEVFHGCALHTDGQVWCWGRAQEGQLGTNEVDPRLVPAPVMLADPISDVVVGRFSTFLVRQGDGALLATGRNCGVLGLGTLDRPHVFTAVTR